jgi:single-strand DNA-binding protein
MAYLNKVMLIGNLGKDPEVRVTATGKKKVSFSLATSRKYRDSNGDPREQTDWHNVIGWGKTAELIEDLKVSKGNTLYVEGQLTYRSWDDQSTGQKKFVTEINLDSFQILKSTERLPKAEASGYSDATSPAVAEDDLQF